MAKQSAKDLPPKTIKIGDLVHTIRETTGWSYVGFVHGDSLSPGGMAGYFLVAWMFRMGGPLASLYSPGVIKKAYIQADLIEPLEMEGEIIIANDISKWKDQLKHHGFDVRPLGLESLSKQIDGIA